MCKVPNRPNGEKTCWIAEIKREMGFPMRRAWNSGMGIGCCPMSTRVEECDQRVYPGRGDHTVKEFFESVGVFNRIMLGLAFIGVIVAGVLVLNF